MPVGEISKNAMTVLEKRYLNYQPWEQISVDMGYSSQHIFKIHYDALEVCDRLLKR